MGIDAGLDTETDSVLASAHAHLTVAAAASTALTALQTLQWWQLPELDVLAVARSVEHLTRLGHTAQIRVAGEIDYRHTAERFGAASTVALLRDTLTISAQDARGRVNTARAVLPQPQPSGATADPQLPELGRALNAGVIGAEQTRIIVATLKAVPATVDPGMLAAAKTVLVDTGTVTGPKPFAAFAKAVALTLDPDGTPDKDPADRVVLSISSPNPDTGLTGFRGLLDDLGVELLGQAITGLAAPRPEPDGTPDPRTPKTRNGQAFTDLLRRYLNLGDAPTHGGQRPHVTITITLDDLRTGTGVAHLELGGTISAAQARVLACDAAVTPAVLGTASEVLDVGRANRLFTPAIRK